MSGQWPGFGNTGHVFVSPTTRLLAAEKSPVVDPSALMSGSVLASFACAPALSTLTRTVSPVSRSCTKTSGHSPAMSLKNGPQVFVSPATRFVAIESNATRRPSPLILAPKADPPRIPGPTL